MDKVLLIDGMNQVWRATVAFGKPKEHKLCFVLNGCEHEKKSPHCTCGAAWSIEKQKCFSYLYDITYSFFRSLRPIIEMFTPDKVFFVLEGRAAFRRSIYPEYKANRLIKTASKQETYNKVIEQSEHIVRIMKHFPITTVRADEFECDDVISTLCRTLKDEDVTIVSNDSDFIQLLQLGYDNCRIYNPIKKTFMEAPAYHYLAWKCLAGDTSDNVEGLVGDDRARTLVSNPEKFKAFMSSEENRARFNINKLLIEFLSVPDDQMMMDGNVPDWESVRKEFDQMDFQSIINPKSWKKYTDTFNCIKY